MAVVCVCVATVAASLWQALRGGGCNGPSLCGLFAALTSERLSDDRCGACVVVFPAVVKAAPKPKAVGKAKAKGNAKGDGKGKGGKDAGK